MFRKERIKLLTSKLEEWCLDNRKATVVILFSILIGSLSFVLLRKKDRQYKPMKAYQEINKVKQSSSANLSNSIADLQRNISLLSDLSELESLDSLSHEDSLKLNEITKSILK